MNDRVSVPHTQLVVTAILGALGYTLDCRWQNAACDVDELKAGVAAVAIYGGLVLFWNLLLAPVRLHRDLKTQIPLPGPSETERRVRLKSLLGEASKRGNTLVASGPSIPEAEAWATDVNTLIEEAFGTGEADHFQDDSGYTFLSGNRTRHQLWMEGRLRRLAELIPRVDTANLQPGFDPNTWKWGAEFAQATEDRKRIHKRLGDFLKDGKMLKSTIPANDIEKARSEYMAWHTDIVQFLKKEPAFGTAYLVIVHSDIDLGGETTNRSLADLDRQLGRITKWMERFED